MRRESPAQISGKAQKIVAAAKTIVLCLAPAVTVACGRPQATAPTLLSVSPEAQKTVTSEVRKVGDVPGGESWYKLQFVNERDGWLADNRNIWRTTDGGRSWGVAHSIKRPQDLPPSIPAHRLKEYAEAFTEIEGFHFANASHGLIQTSNGTYRTEDGGQTWAKIATPLDSPKGRMGGIKFLSDGRVGWIAGGVYRPAPKGTVLKTPNSAVSPDNKSVLYGAIFRTDDGGLTWSQELITPETGMLFRLHFVDPEHGWAVGEVGVYYTKNRGERWESGNLNGECARHASTREAEGYPIDVFFIDTTTGWLSYKHGRVAKSTDGGQSWCALPQTQNALPEESGRAFFLNIYFAGQGRGWGLAADGSLHQTKDGGATWTRVDTNLRFEDIYFLGPGLGWAVSGEGLFRINS